MTAPDDTTAETLADNEAAARVDRYLDGRPADDLIDWNGGGAGPELLASDLRKLLAAIGRVATQGNELQAELAAERAAVERVRAGLTLLLADLAKAEPKHFSLGLMRVRTKGLIAALDGAHTTTEGA